MPVARGAGRAIAPAMQRAPVQPALIRLGRPLLAGWVRIEMNVGHGISFDRFAPSHRFRKSRSPGRIEETRTRLRRPGKRAVKQKEPEMICMYQHDLDIGSPTSLVNRRWRSTPRIAPGGAGLGAFAPSRRTQHLRELERRISDGHLCCMKMFSAHKRFLPTAGKLLNRR